MIPHSLTGKNATGNVLSVTLYARDAEHARSQYAFRYGGLGYVLPASESDTETPEKPVRVRTRKRRKKQ